MKIKNRLSDSAMSESEWLEQEVAFREEQFEIYTAATSPHVSRYRLLVRIFREPLTEELTTDFTCQAVDFTVAEGLASRRTDYRLECILAVATSVAFGIAVCYLLVTYGVDTLKLPESLGAAASKPWALAVVACLAVSAVFGRMQRFRVR